MRRVVWHWDGIVRVGICSQVVWVDGVGGFLAGLGCLESTRGGAVVAETEVGGLCGVLESPWEEDVLSCGSGMVQDPREFFDRVGEIVA